MNDENQLILPTQINGDEEQPRTRLILPGSLGKEESKGLGAKSESDDFETMEESDTDDLERLMSGTADIDPEEDSDLNVVEGETASSIDHRESSEYLYGSGNAGRGLIEAEDEDEARRIFETILADAIRYEASDVHLNPNDVPAFTVDGDILRLHHYGILTEDFMAILTQSVISNVAESEFVRELELDTSYMMRLPQFPKRSFRLNLGRTFDYPTMTLRLINDSIPNPQQLGIPEEIRDWMKLPNGLILINGSTGTGKDLRVDTIVHTSKGPRSIGEVSVGDELKHWSGYYYPVQWMSEVNSSPTLYRITLDNGETVYAGAGHQWVYRSEEVSTSRGSTLSNIVLYEEVMRKEGAMRETWLTPDEIEAYLAERGVAVRGVKTALDYYEVESDEAGRRNLFYSTVALASKHLSDFGDLNEWEEGWVIGYTEDLEPGFKLPVTPVPTGNSRVSSVVIEGIERIEQGDADYGETVCLGVESPDHTFVIGGGEIVTHNSSTLASLLREVQLRDPKKIVTIEKPIEFIFGTEGKAVITQREVGRDTRSFKNGLVSAMRQNPNIIFIGEVRDQEEVDTLLSAAESGHLAVSTIHANSCAESINRIKTMYAGQDQLRILSSLATKARGFMNQQLVKKKTGRGRFAVREILPVNQQEVREMIADGDVEGIRGYMMDRKLLMEHALSQAVKEGKCTKEEARSKAPDPLLFDQIHEDSH